MKAKLAHRVGANLDYGVDWAPDEEPWLGVGETITASSWVVAGDDSALVKGTTSFDGTTTTVWVSGGTARADYTLTNTITTSQGRTALRALSLTCMPA